MFELPERQEISWQAELLLASQEGLCPMEFVSELEPIIVNSANGTICNSSLHWIVEVGMHNLKNMSQSTEF